MDSCRLNFVQFMSPRPGANFHYNPLMPRYRTFNQKARKTEIRLQFSKSKSENGNFQKELSRENGGKVIE